MKVARPVANNSIASGGDLGLQDGRRKTSSPRVAEEGCRFTPSPSPQDKPTVRG
jgi:hypothetical protein